MEKFIQREILYGPPVKIRIMEPEDFYNVIRRNNKLIKNKIYTERSVYGRNVNHLVFNLKNNKNIQNFFKIYARVKNVPFIGSSFSREMPIFIKAGILSNKAKKISKKYRNMFRQPIPPKLNNKKRHPMAERILSKRFAKIKFENVLKQIKKVSSPPSSKPNIPTNFGLWRGPYKNSNANNKYYQSPNMKLRYYPKRNVLVTSNIAYRKAANKFRLPRNEWK